MSLEDKTTIVEAISTGRKHGWKLPMVIFEGPKGTTIMELWRYLEQNPQPLRPKADSVI
jgi:hypothetical protein